MNPLEILDQMPPLEKKERWFCGHTKKCGWSGTEDQLEYLKTRKLKSATVGCCPKCGYDKFWVREVLP